MQPQYNRYNLEPRFKEYLLAENINAGTVKQYLSDFRHFFGWISFEVSHMTSPQDVKTRELHEYINSELIEAYKSFLTKGGTPHKTINRRLSTVRKFCTFLQVQGIIANNPAHELTNVQEQGDTTQAPAQESTLMRYKQYLEKSNSNKRNQYLVSDIEELFAVIHSNT